MTSERDTERPPTTGPIPAKLGASIDAASRLNVAMLENAVPLISRLVIHNREDQAVRDIAVAIELAPDFGDVWTTHIAEIPPGGDYHLAQVELPLDRQRLVNLHEAERAELVICARTGTAAPCVLERRPVEVLAYNEWARDSVPQLLSAFVLPNHPGVAATLQAARTLLQKETGNPSLDGYQSGSSRRVYEIARAIYQTIQRLDITYVNPPASFEVSGQKIRTPEQILDAQMATCLDLSTYLAACLEATGLHPVIFLVHGHAFLGVWLEARDLAEGFSDDGAKFRKLIKLGHLLAFDSSTVAARPEQSFQAAKERAVAALQNDEHFDYAIDIHGCRAQRYRPLPLRLSKDAYSAAAEVLLPPTDAARDAHQVDSFDAAVQHERREPRLSDDAPASSRLETWKRRLLDLTGRNRLLNFRETKQTVEMLCSDLGRLEDALAARREFRLHPCPAAFSEADPRDADALRERTGEDAQASFLSERLGRNELFTSLSEDSFESHITAVYRAARESLQETGANTLYLTLGQLVWYESDESDQRRLAPILLIPVELRRDAKERRFFLASSDDDTRINVTLLEKLRNDFGLIIPELEELPEDHSGVDVPAILRHVIGAIRDMPRWDVLERAHLANVSFSKFLMWTDLETRGDAILQSELVGHLAYGNRRDFPSQGAFSAPERIDDRNPAELLCPLDSDSSQQAAVAAAAEGKTFVLQGPPGTGKSQTITNLIAHCLANGKRVLFVSEKRAALDVVYDRLSRLGLDTYSLELHSSKAKKTEVLKQLRNALEAEQCAEPPSFGQHAAKLAAERDHLNAYVRALHAPRVLGKTVFEGLSSLIQQRDAPPLELDTHQLENADSLERAREVLARLSDAAQAVSPVAKNPWQSVRVRDWRPLSSPNICEQAIEALRASAERLKPHAERWATRLTPSHSVRSVKELEEIVALAKLLCDTPKPPRVLLEADDWQQVRSRAEQLIEVGRERDRRRGELASRYRTQALLSLDLDHLAQRFHAYAHAFFLLAWLMLWSARRTLRDVRTDGVRPAAREGLEDLDSALAVRDLDTKLETHRELAAALFGPAWSGDGADWDWLERVLAWTEDFRRTSSDLLAEIEPVARARVHEALSRFAYDGAAAHSWSEVTALEECFQDFTVQLDKACKILGLHGDARFRDETRDLLTSVESTCDGWMEALPGLHAWERYRAVCDEVDELGLARLHAAVDTGELSPSQVLPAFERAFFSNWLDRQIAEEPALRFFEGGEQDFRVTNFKSLDRKLLELTREAAVARVSERVPQRAEGPSAPGELGILRREFEKQRRHLPIRRLLQRIPNLIARLKPCFLMSPLSVAQYLDPSVPAFDLVVFDEASQIPTHDAIGALARGKKAVIVGDSKQLPPTTFFDKRDSDDEELDDDEVEELESILDECVASGVPQLRLRWHYRSRHESLIAFSNAHYYENRLNTFPSPIDRTERLGVSIRYVDGTYEKGTSRSNPLEAQAVVAEALRRLLSPSESQRSLGIVTFSRAQQVRVEDLLDQARREHPEIERFFDDASHEPVIVKNLENIQGDERDVILFSICYGPDGTGKVAMRFGPLNLEGGERRLNVAMTRARQQLVVFSTLRPDHIDTARTRARGVHHLKTFLEYAERGPRAITESAHVSHETSFHSPFEEQVYERLAERGWHLETQVGCAGYRIDLGVKDPEFPGRFLLGIECDGAAYHSAKTARDRDRLRADVLKGLGWELHRIWSTDWWQAPDREIEKVEHALRVRQDRLRVEAEQAKSEAMQRTDEPAAETAPSQPAQAAHNSPVVAPALIALSAGESRPTVYAHAPQPAMRPSVGREHALPSSGYQAACVAANVRMAEQAYEPAFADELRTQALTVIQVEAPITMRLLARRIAPYWSLRRTTKKFERRVHAILGAGKGGTAPVQVRDGVLWRLDQDPAEFKDFRAPGIEPESKRDATEIPSEEIRNAAQHVLRQAVALPHDELVRETARQLGFARTGKTVAECVQKGIQRLITEGAAIRSGETISLA